MLDLPVEIVDEILDHLPNKDLSNVRLACRALAELGAGHLFATLRLSERLGSLVKAHSIAEDARLCRHVRALSVCLEPQNYEDRLLLSLAGSGAWKEMTSTQTAIVISAVDLCRKARAGIECDTIPDVFLQLIRDLWYSLFSSLNLPNLKRIHIIELRMRPQSRDMAPGLIEMLYGLDNLNLSYRSRSREALVALHSAAPTIRTLELTCLEGDTPWDLFAFENYPTIRFPCLKRLTLRNFTTDMRLQALLKGYTGTLAVLKLINIHCMGMELNDLHALSLQLSLTVFEMEKCTLWKSSECAIVDFQVIPVRALAL